MTDNLIHNRFTHYKHARWIALGCYLLGNILIFGGYQIEADWSVYVMIAGLVTWLPTVMWCAKRIEEGR